MVGLKVLPARPVRDEVQPIAGHAERLHPLAQPLPMAPVGHHQQQARARQCTHHLGPQRKGALAQLARVVQAPQREVAAPRGRQGRDFDVVAQRVVAPVAVGQQQGALAVGLRLTGRVQPGIADPVVHRLDAGGARVGQPCDLHRGGFAGEDARPAVGHVHGQVHQDIDAVGADALAQRLVAEPRDIAPDVDQATDAPGERIGALDAGVGVHLDAGAVVVREQRHREQ